MFDRQSLRRAFGAFVVSCIFPFGMAAAQDERVLEEIVVTADFRARPATELPSSVSVLERQDIEALAVQHFEELVRAVPNLNWSGDGHRARYFQIRGVGELEQYEGAPNPSVGFLIDDIDFSGIGTIATLFDIEQIEVLRGPQGSRYGANALAGLVYVQSAEPGDQWTGKVEVGGGQDDAFSAGAAFGGPLTADRAVTFRLSAHHHGSDGFRDNPYLRRSDTNRRDETAARGKLLWEPGNDWRVKLTAMWSDIDNGYDAFAIDNSLTVLSDEPGRDAQRSVGAALKASWSGNSRFELTSVTTAADSDIRFGFDADWGNEDAWSPFTYDFVSASDRGRRTLSQEFRLASTSDGRLFGDSTDWLAGLYVMELEDRLSTFNQGEYVDPVSGFSDSLDDRFSSRFEALSTALFGQLNVDAFDSGQIGIGLRIERRTTDYSDTANLRLDPGETMVGGELSYTHFFEEGLTGYVSLSRGYKAGGFNLGPVPDGGRQFAREALWNLEAGVKSRWLDDSLQFNGAVFVSRRRDQQVRTSVQLNPNDPASFIFYTDNAADGRTIGLEAQLRWLPNPTWEFYSSIGLLDAEFESTVGSTSMLDGRDQAHAPNSTLALGGAWRHEKGLFARLDASARDAFYFDVSHNQRSRRNEIVNARLGFEAERWTAQAWVRNVLDETYAVRGFYFGNEPPDFPNQLFIRQGDPRQLGVNFEMRF
jgi:outer membrane receptor protein involved in Fe transport